MTKTVSQTILQGCCQQLTAWIKFVCLMYNDIKVYKGVICRSIKYELLDVIISPIRLWNTAEDQRLQNVTWPHGNCSYAAQMNHKYHQTISNKDCSLQTAITDSLMEGSSKYQQELADVQVFLKNSWMKTNGTCHIKSNMFSFLYLY